MDCEVGRSGGLRRSGPIAEKQTCVGAAARCGAGLSFVRIVAGAATGGWLAAARGRLEFGRGAQKDQPAAKPSRKCTDIGTQRWELRAISSVQQADWSRSGRFSAGRAQLQQGARTWKLLGSKEQKSGNWFAWRRP
ncbi:unnamed protein product, partial [Phaeothamnion confervicola]